jgi:hypothetical protein
MTRIETIPLYDEAALAEATHAERERCIEDARIALVRLHGAGSGAGQRASTAIAAAIRARTATQPEGNPSDGAIYAAASRDADPQGYDKLLDEVTAEARAALAHDGGTREQPEVYQIVT